MTHPTGILSRILAPGHQGTGSPGSIHRLHSSRVHGTHRAYSECSPRWVGLVSIGYLVISIFRWEKLKSKDCRSAEYPVTPQSNPTSNSLDTDTETRFPVKISIWKCKSGTEVYLQTGSGCFFGCLLFCDLFVCFIL